MTSGIIFTQMGILLVVSSMASLEASLLDMKSEPSECTIEEWATIDGFGAPSSLVSSSSQSYIVGTNQKLVKVTDSIKQEISLGLLNIDVGGVALDADDNVIFTDCQRYCIRSYDLQTYATETWAGKCSHYGDATGTMAEARFSQLFNLAANADGSKVYVVQQRAKIKVITPAADKVEYKVQNMQQVYALVVASNGDLYFAAKQALCRIGENSDDFEVVAGGLYQTGYTDSTLTQSRFRDLQGLLIIEEYDWVVAADPINHALRIIDFDGDSVTSIGTGSEDVGTLDICGLKNTSGLLLEDGELILIDDFKIKHIKCSDSAPTTAAPTTAAPTTTSTTAAPATTSTTAAPATTSTTAAPAMTSTVTAPTTTSIQPLTSYAAAMTSSIPLIPSTTLMLVKCEYSVIGKRTDTAMVLKKNGPEESTFPGTALETHNADKRRDCLLLCVKAASCQCLAYDNGSCTLYTI